MHEFHIDIINQIHASNIIYKTRFDSSQQRLNFNLGDYIMIQIRPKQYPLGTIKKLQAHSLGPFKVFKQIGSNAYDIDIPSDYGISSTFYRGFNYF